ncbi:dynamin family protein [Duganella hordei]|uniref:dynamin family protein n=1 Tax=Duganella hordei TaxID=2865934 RepID=UPI00333F4481
MQLSETWLDALNAALPAAWQQPMLQVADSVLQPERPLRIVLAGAFTVGKSSLVNMLVGGDWLPAAMEETTALPTFIEHGVGTRMQLVNVDGTSRELTAEQFSAAVVQAPPNAAFALLTLAQEWLSGAVLVDLPGLGGMSQANQQYALAQIQQADTVLYLIPPRGPDAGDLATLERIRTMGKHVTVLATRWDEVERAVAAGEKAPDLHAWEAQIEEGSKLRIGITPVNKTGMGREAVIRFVCEARSSLAGIRLQRLRAELTPLLENALGQNALMQSACHSDSVEARQAAHAELLRRKMALTELKADVHVQATADRTASAATAKELADRHGIAFNAAMSRLAASIPEEAQWADFVAAGTEAQQCALDALARDMQELSVAYGTLKLPTSAQQEFQLRLPPPQPVDSQDFLDVGRMAALQSALEEKQRTQAQLDQTRGIGGIPDSETHRHALHQALRERHALLTQPLPQITQVNGNNKGAILGRILGEVADIGTMFINPAAAGAKIAAVVGKGAKLAKITVNAAKVARAATKTVKVLKATKIGGKVVGVPPAVIDKLGMLEAISFSYWGERIGSALDGPQEVSVVDPDAYAQQQQDLRAADERILSYRSDLARSARLAEEHKLSGWALEQNRKELAMLKADLDELTVRTEQQALELLAQQTKDRAQLVLRYVEQALAQWRKVYVQQSEAMVEMLRLLVKHHWEERADAMIRERLAELTELTLAVDAAPAEQQATLEALRTEADGLRSSLRLLVQ